MSIILQKYVQAYHTVFFHIKAKSKKMIQIKRKVSEFIIDETLLKVGENYVWLWIAIEPIDKIVLGILVAFILNIGDVIADRMSKSIDDINLIDRFPF